MACVKNVTFNREIRVPFRTTSNVHINRYTMWTKYNWGLGDTNNFTVRRIIDCNRGNWTQNMSWYTKRNAWLVIWYYMIIINHITENMKCDAANSNKNNNRKCSSLHSNIFSSKYTGSVRVRYYEKYVNWDLYKKYEQRKFN